MTTVPSPIAIPYRPARQREIAERAGVSVSTVSRVLSGSAGIGLSVRARVLEAATLLGHPSGDHDRALRHVGLFVSTWRSLSKSQPSHLFHADILTGAEAECRACGIQLGYTVIDPQSDGEALIRERVDRRRLDAPLFFDLDDLALLERTSQLSFAGTIRRRSMSYAHCNPRDPTYHMISRSLGSTISLLPHSSPRRSPPYVSSGRNWAGSPFAGLSSVRKPHLSHPFNSMSRAVNSA